MLLCNDLVLKPCPFCGQIPELKVDNLGEYVTHKDQGCPIGSPSKIHPDAWNRRVKPETAVEDESPSYYCENYMDGNIQFALTGSTFEDAAINALNKLGWHIVEESQY